VVYLQIAQTRTSKCRNNVQPDLLVVIVLAGGLDVNAVLFVPDIQPISERHSLRFMVGTGIYGGCRCTEFLYALLSSLSINALVLGFACAGVYSDLEPAFPASVCAFARL